MKIIKRILIGFGLCILLLTGVGFLMPATLDVSRSVTIHAPISSIFPLIANFKSGWTMWNTFDDSSPDIVYSYSGPEAGVGAVQAWKSKKMGDGVMTMTAADPERGVEIELKMGHQFQLRGSLWMQADDVSLTQLTWTDHCQLGHNPFNRLIGPFIKYMIGKSFDSSLANIKKIAESSDEMQLD